MDVRTPFQTLPVVPSRVGPEYDQLPLRAQVIHRDTEEVFAVSLSPEVPHTPVMSDRFR